jgi:hypothetical protein
MCVGVRKKTTAQHTNVMSSSEDAAPRPGRLQRVVSFEETDLQSNRTTAGMVELEELGDGRSFVAPQFSFDSPPMSPHSDVREATFAFLPPPPEFDIDHISLEDGPAKVKSLVEEVRGLGSRACLTPADTCTHTCTHAFARAEPQGGGGEAGDETGRRI